MEELDLKEIFSIFWNKKLEIILITLILMGVGVIYSYFYVTPKYKSSTRLVLVQSSATISTNGDRSITTTDLSINSQLVDTYSELIKTNAILGQVATNLSIPQNEIEKIKKEISVTAKDNTEIIEITVKDEDPNFSAELANEVAAVFMDKIGEIYNISNIYLLDRAVPTDIPANINHIKDITIFAFAGLVIAFAYSFIANLLDNTVKTETDIENIQGLLVLSSIPNYDAEFKSKKGGRR